MTKQLFIQDSQNKRKLSNIVLCYHGCVLARADALIFREHVEDIKVQVVDLLQAGYRFVSPSEYDNWYEGAPGYDGPLAVIHLDDGLDSIIPICEWFIDRQLPFGIAVISSRNQKYNPQQGFLHWGTIRRWVDSGYCEILRHTHNIHNLTIVDVSGSAAPVLEGPCWIDDPADIVYKKPGDGRWYWDFGIIDKITWGFPLLGSDPYSDYTDPITADVYFIADTTTDVTIIRFWAALHRPAGAGYVCTVEVIADGVSLGDHVITPKAYDTRTQWVEREFYTLQLNASFGITSGSSHHLQFVSKTAGRGCFMLYVLPETENSGFYCVTSCKSLTPGKLGPTYADFPAGRPWPGRAGLILASGSGRQASMAEYQAYIQADIDAQSQSIENWLRADWYQSLPPTNPNRKNWSRMAIAGSYADGTVVSTVLSMTMFRPPGYPSGLSTMTIEALTLRVSGATSFGSPIGLRFAALVKIEIGGSPNGPWSKLADWVPGWSYYHWEVIDIDSTVVAIGGTYWFRFTTLNRSYNADYPVVEHPEDPKTTTIGTNHGVLTVFMDSPIPQISPNGAHYSIDEMAPESWYPAYYGYYPGWSSRQQMVSNITRIERDDFFQTPGGHNTIFSNVDAFDSFFLNLIGDFSIGSTEPFPKYALDVWVKNSMYGGAVLVNCKGNKGNLQLGCLAAIRNPSAIVYDQMIYPFGSFNADSSPTADIKPVEGLSAELLSLFDAAGIRSGYTIWPSRNDLPDRFREPFCRSTAHTKSRLLAYGDVTQTATRSDIAHYTGLRWADAAHGGIKWQIAIEPDNNGNATVRNCYAALDTVAFDAYFFRLPDVDHVDGWILADAINDGGTYDGIVYADDKGFLQARGVHCSLIISNYDDVLGDVSPDIASYVVNNGATFIPLITGLAAGWDGITCNLEGIPETDRSAATAFFQDLGRAMRFIGKQLHITAPARTNTDYDIGSEWWWGWCDHAGIIGYVDRMKIMSYTETGPGTPPGPHAPDWFIKSTYDYIKAIIPQEHRKRILVGVNCFGHIWQDATGAVVDYGSSHECMAAAIQRGAEIRFDDGEAHFKYGAIESWWGSPATINRAVDTAIKYGFGGVGVWKGDDGDIDEHYPLWPQIGLLDMSSFIDLRFPVDIRYGFTGGPAYKVDVGGSDNGEEQRSLRWTEPLYEYTADLQRFDVNLEELQAFFRIMKGRYHTFRFKDWLDYRADESYLGTADGTNTVFQLRKTYQAGSYFEYRTITKPVADSVVVKDNGAVVTALTIDYSTGVVTFDAAPANGNVITASFDFDVHVRFDQDSLPIARNNPAAYDANGIKLIEVRR